MYKASKWAPQEALRNLDAAFQGFFRRAGRGETPGYPRFKSRRRGVGGFRVSEPIHVTDKGLRLPRVGVVRIKPGDHGHVPVGTYGGASVSERAGRWYVSVLMPEVEASLPNGGAEVGIDLGVVNLAVLSDGTVFENPRVLEWGQRKIQHLQRAVSRKQKGSKNRERARKRLARAHARVSNVRSNAIHHVTTAIAKRYGRVAIEELRVRDMTRRGHSKERRALNRSVLDVSLAEFRRQLEYKGRLYGCTVVRVDPAYTSQTCSVCGCIDSRSRPTQSEFRCVHCGYEVNADLNAAINIRVAGSCPDTENACGVNVRRPVPRSGTAVGEEAGIDDSLKGVSF